MKHACELVGVRQKRCGDVLIEKTNARRELDMCFKL